MLRTATLALLMSACRRRRRWRRTNGRAPTTCRPTRSPATARAGTVVAKDYDGGQPTNAPDLAGKEITVIDVPKLIGIGYFAATTEGPGARRPPSSAT